MMIELLRCCKGLCRKPKITGKTDTEILSFIDPMKPKIVDKDDKDYYETVYDSKEIRVHVIENARTGEIDEADPFHCMLYSFLYIEESEKDFIHVINLQDHKKFVVAYEKFEEEGDTEYFEEIILELIRLTSTLMIEGLDSESIIRFLKTHIEAGIVYENKD